MAKQNRGKSLWRLPSRGRGTCPVCGSTRTKLLHSVQGMDQQVITVCKRCRAK